ncbi:glycosyltransferase family 2 protein [Alkalitalea saponilacus]|uniref:Glycosyltransferase involved in cell wall bisynthesis n=1 Tax=Alkalitalea saponilacus TaxID=889453 RepID=A0A1T5H089_9BACT|nr:glycosyltransferase family 2 protein [Alkalitalea saponilacus]ASB50956.1 glycosyl transferase family 2 [Alkalitalea saponilacus]SKC14001.1 Glycosyltransferase involved in cell wall bisynthesis [Alkalitalea saponilacus]
MTIANSPLFSILIANYNNGEYLEECLKSVFAQTYKNWEIIIVDDGSKDEISHVIYRKYINNPKIRIYFNQINKGCGYTKRRCAEEAKGEICGFLDPDDIITPDALELMVEKHWEMHNHSLIYSTHYMCDQELKIKSINQQIQQIDQRGYFCSTGNKVSAFATYKNDRYKQTAGINPLLKRAVDQDLYYKLDETGLFHFINKPLYYYRRHRNGISTDSNELKAIYWFQIVKEDTFIRRVKKKHVYNLTEKEINQGWSSYYIKKAFQKSRQHQFCSMFYLLYKSLQKGPVTRQHISIGLYPIRRYWHP